jgi:16S rRNA (guanine527-N7)-methyltransferase
MVHVSRETIEQLHRYAKLLVQWNKSINLIAKSTESVVFRRHIEDCLQLASYIPDKELTILDIGSGAGLPGIVLAICGYTNVTMVDSDRKKIHFLKEVSRILDVSPQIIYERIECVEPRVYDIITSRACANISQLLVWASPFLGPDSYCLFPKGKKYGIELAAASDWDFTYLAHPSVTNTGSVILELRKIVSAS